MCCFFCHWRARVNLCLLFVVFVLHCILLFFINTKNSIEKAGGKSLGRVLEEFFYFRVFVNSSMVISSNNSNSSSSSS